MSNEDEKTKKETMRALNKKYPRTESGFSQLIHGQLYFKYLPLYIYYMRDSIKSFLPEPEDLKKPQGVEFEVVDELVKMAVNHCVNASGSIETNSYHAKVLRLEDAEQLVALNENLDLGDLPKSIMPYDVARTAVIENPDSIAVLDCVCRTAKGDKGCYPRDVCLIIGEPWVSWFLARDNYLNAHRITSDEALKILRECHERGNVHAGFFKDAAAGRFYCICNCCPCCCTALHCANYVQVPMFAGSGFVAKIDMDKCVNCGICEKKCNFMAIYRDKDNHVQINNEICKGCEGCLKVCNMGAISMEQLDPSVLAPLDVKALQTGNKSE